MNTIDNLKSVASSKKRQNSVIAGWDNINVTQVKGERTLGGAAQLPSLPQITTR